MEIHTGAYLNAGEHLLQEVLDSARVAKVECELALYKQGRNKLAARTARRKNYSGREGAHMINAGAKRLYID